MCGIETALDDFYYNATDKKIEILLSNNYEALCKKCHAAKYNPYNKWPTYDIKQEGDDKLTDEQKIQRKKRLDEQKEKLDEIEKKINKEKQDKKRIDDIAFIKPTGEKLQELKNELLDQ